MPADQPAHAPLELRSWAAAAFGSEHALSPIQLAIGGAVLDSVWSQGIAEGRRQATEEAAQIIDPDVVQAYGTDIATLVGAAVRISHQDGWRQATEGWDREWGVDLHGRGAQCVLDEHAARGIVAGCPDDLDPKVFARLVGPWEPVEQPALDEADWSGHQSFTLLPCVKIEGPHPKHTWSHRDEPCEGHVCPGEQPEGGAR